MNYIVIDTCIILHILRNNPIGQRAIGRLESFGDELVQVVSVVTKGELQSLKKQHNWGESRSRFLNTFLRDVTYVDIYNDNTLLHEAYAELDAYSQGKAPDKNGNFKKGSSVNMGKNDLWIAATAYILDAPLLTTDKDFGHLNNVYITLINF